MKQRDTHTRVSVYLDEDLTAAVDSKRGVVPRATYILQLIKDSGLPRAIGTVEKVIFTEED